MAVPPSHVGHTRLPLTSHSTEHTQLHSADDLFKHIVGRSGEGADNGDKGPAG